MLDNVARWHAIVVVAAGDEQSGIRLKDPMR